MSKNHKKVVQNWGLFVAEVEKQEIMPKDKVKFTYNGKVRIGTVDRIGQREDGSNVIAVDTEEGMRNFDADLISGLDVLELAW
jgi:hypothetical protein